jgi:hypothetical protein
MDDEDEEVRIKDALSRISEAERNGDYKPINEKLLKKRLKWYEDNKDRLNLRGSDVRKAYALLIVEYLGLGPMEAPILFESESKIVWGSYNRCPVLEACIRGHYDTREICKRGWEQSVQALIEKINPDLLFSRNYNTLRPYGDYCEEAIEIRGR